MGRVPQASATMGGFRQGYPGVIVWPIMLMLIAPHVVLAQQSTAPPSSLSTTPLSPDEYASDQLPFCDLCRKPEPRAGSDVRPHRLPRNKALRSHKKPKGMHRPSRHSLRSLLPHYSPERLGARERTLDSWKAQAIDGDTIRYGAERIRIRGLNASELTEPGGQEAQERLSQLLREGTIRIVPHGKDVYDRTVADVFVNDQNIAEILTREGYAKPRP
jgi:endonuclease YncB( thermonuclease family)